MKHLLIAKVKEVAYTLREATKLAKDTFTARQRIGAFHLSVNKVATYGQADVYLDNDILLAFTLTRPEVPNALLSQSITGKPLIYVNQGFVDLPESMKLAILAHEEGHVHYKHSKKRLGYWSEITFGYGKALEMEMEADAYAQAKGHNMLGYLERLSEHETHNSRGLRLRIQRLRELNNVSN